MGRCARWGREHATALALTAATSALLCLLFAADRRLGLCESASTRYRFHAIPVGISALYHNRPHDYTAHRNLAMRFHDAGRDIDEQIRETVAPDFPIDGGTYYWVADDRGLADFVYCAFRLFGPEVKSLSNFWFLVLSLSIIFYTIGFWRTPAALIAPPLALFAWIAIASVAPDRLPFPNAQGYWGEEIALYESRMFDGLALLAVLHLALLAGTSVPASRVTWVTAIAQAVLLIVLYHARSSLGWQFAALFSLAGLRIAWWVLNRTRAENRLPTFLLVRPLVVVALLCASLAGLKQYQRAVYHPHYSKDYGPRTFWHNALMGLAYHPKLRDDLPMAHCDDRDAVDLVLARMVERDPALDRNVWNWQAALNSLGNHNRFDWNRYERVAREIYLESWRTRPRQVAECYWYYKPRDALQQARLAGDRLASRSLRGEATELLTGCVIVLGALGVVVIAARRDPDIRACVPGLTRIIAILIPFSLIPGIAFYPALTTGACFCLLGCASLGLLGVRIAAQVRFKGRLMDRGP